MRVTVQYVAQIRRLVGCAEEVIDIAGGTLADLIRALAIRHPDAARLLLNESGEPSKSLLYFVNDAPFEINDVLPVSTTLTILSPMAGGSQPGCCGAAGLLNPRGTEC